MEIYMKKLTAILCTLAFCVLSLFCAACGSSGKTTAKIEYVTEDAIIMSIETTDGKATAFDALKSLRNQDLISFDYTESSFGAYVTSINGKAGYSLNTSKGYSWMLYTTDTDSANEETTVTIDGVVLCQSALGASSLKVKAGEIYAWVFEYYDYSW